MNAGPSGLDLAPAAVVVSRRSDGTLHLRSPQALGSYARQVGLWLRRWAAAAPERTFLAERQADGAWRHLTYGAARTAADALSQALLDRGLGRQRPLMILSGNGIDHALLALAAMQVGIPAVPVSAAYGLTPEGRERLAAMAALVEPGLAYARDGAAYAAALQALAAGGCRTVVGEAAAALPQAERLADLLQCRPAAAVEAAFAAVEPEDAAKFLFTSGSTGMPKAVINTHRMLCAQQQMMAQLWRFLETEPPVLVDWMPWSHTSAGNNHFNMVLRNGGAIYIDEGRPNPGQFATTVRNLGEISPSIYLSVPAGLALLVDHLEADEALRRRFFGRLRLLVTGGALIAEPVWRRLQALARDAAGGEVMVVSGWGSTETTSTSTLVHFPAAAVGSVGLPLPGVDLKLVPEADRLAVRVRGPNVTPGYLKRPDLTTTAFDDEGYFIMGDALRPVDPAVPEKGLVFDGRLAEDFKLASGTWVRVGALRARLLAALAPALREVVIAGPDQGFLTALAWPELAACRAIAGLPDGEAAAVLQAPGLRAFLTARLAAYNSGGGASWQVRRLLLLSEPPSAAAGEITEKGSINQRLALTRRAAAVERLYAEPADPELVTVPEAADCERPAARVQQRGFRFETAILPRAVRPHVMVAFRFTGEYDSLRLEASCHRAVARHEALRTVLAERQGEVRQILLASPQVEFCRLALPPAADLATVEAHVREIGRASIRRPFDLERGPLLRLTEIAAGPLGHYLLIHCHHMVSDGWSVYRLGHEVIDAYVGRSSPPPLQFADAVAWQERQWQEPVPDTVLDFWRDNLAGPAARRLLGRQPSPERGVDHLAGRSRLLPEVLGRRLERCAQALGVTPFVLFLAAYVMLLTRYGIEPEPVVTMPVLNRRQRGFERIFGFLANILPFRVRGAAADPSFATLVGHIDADLRLVLRYQHFGVARIGAALYPAEYAARPQLSRLLFNLVPFTRSRRRAGGLAAEVRPDALPPALPSWYDIGGYVVERDDGWWLGLNHYRDVLSDGEANVLLDDYLRLLAYAVDGPDGRLSAMLARLPHRG